MQNHRTLSRRTFLRTSAIAAIGLAGLAACAPAAVGPSGPGAQPAGEAAEQPAAAQVTLTFIVDTINEGHVQVRDKWAQDFMAANPGVQIDHQTVPQDYSVKIQTLMAAGTPADIYRYLQEVTPIITVAEKTMHLQLDDYVAADSYDLTDFRPDSVNLYRWEDKLYALPRDYGHQNVYMNLDLFEEAGVTPPSADWEDPNWTFEAYLDVATRLTKREGERTTQWGCLVNRAQRPWASWLYSNGGALVHMDDRGVATESALTDEASVEALQFIYDLMHTHRVAPTPDLESELGGFELFASGRVGMMITNPSAVNQFRTIEAFQWDVAALPIGKAERRGTGGGGTGWAAAAATQHPDEAWKFVAYISTAQAELDEVAVGATTPARVSVVTSAEFLNPDLPPANAQGFADAQEYVVRDPVHVLWPEITQRIYTPQMDQLWSGAMEPAAVAQAIADEANPLFARSE
jgi:multiple sugar transport system substrate-binding protein